MAKRRNWASGGDFAVLGNGAEVAGRTFRRRRLAVFSGVFALAFGATLIFLFTRPVEYRAAAQLQITPAAVAAPADSTSIFADAASKSFLTEVQVLTSRPLLDTVASDLAKSGGLPAIPGPDTTGGLQRMLSTETVAGTDVVQLQADGAEREFLPRLVNAVVDAYRNHLEASYKMLAASADSDLSEELRILDGKVAAKRAEVDAFRSQHDIVSLERDENQILTRVKGLGTALNDANDRIANAEGHLKALRDSDAGGQAGSRAKDNPTIADMEKRESQIREDLQERGRKYTQQFLDLDPEVKALRARLADLEQQIQTERVSSRKASIAEAQDELASAREVANRLKQQLSDDKQAAQEFTKSFGEYKVLQDDLTQLEDLHRSALERLAKLEAKERESAPRLAVLEPAAMPHAPRRPLYALDAGLGLAGSLMLAFFAVWLVEFFARPLERDPTLVLRESWPGIPIMMGGTPALNGMPAPASLIGPDAAPLAVEHQSPARELTHFEVTELLRAATEDGQLALVLLLMGLSPEETILLGWADIDPDGAVVKIPGDSARVVPLEAPLQRLLAERHAAQPDAAGALLQNAAGKPLTTDDLDNLVVCAAYDAALDHAEGVTCRTVRHTYIVFLLRQGIRLADMNRIVGRIPQDELLAYMRRGSSEGRLPLDRIERTLPALQMLGAARL